MKATNWSYVLIAYASLLAYGLIDNTRGPVFPELLSTGNLTDSQGALFFSICSICTVPGGYSARWLSVSRSSLSSMRIGLFISILGIIGIAQASNYFVLLCGSALYGMGSGAVSVTMNYLINSGVKTKTKQRRFFAGLHSMYAISSLAAPLLAGLLFSYQWHWQRIFFLLGLPT